MLDLVVLVVEDQSLVRMTVRHYLENLGCQVLEADCAERALEICGSDVAVDLLLTDLTLPDRSGRLLAEDVSGVRPALAVLFMTANRDLALDLPVLEKPFDEAELARAVRGLFESD